MVAGTVYVPACSSTTVPDMQPSRVDCSVEAWPGVTVAQTVVLTGRPSGPSGWFRSVSERMPGFQVVVMSGLRRPGGTPLHGPPSQLCPPLLPELDPDPEPEPEPEPEDDAEPELDPE